MDNNYDDRDIITSSEEDDEEDMQFPAEAVNDPENLAMRKNH